MKSLAPLFLLLCVGSVVADEVQIVKEGSDWVPLEYIRDIEPGSALDFSAMGIVDAPAGKHGWLVSRNGHAEFEGRPGVPARFYGVNLCMTANYLRPDEIEKVTDRLIRLGYNAIRIHHHDDEWAKALSGRGRPDSSGGLHETPCRPPRPRTTRSTVSTVLSPHVSARASTSRRISTFPDASHGGNSALTVTDGRIRPNC